MGPLPLSLLFNTYAMVTYDASGKRLSGMSMAGLLGGHLGMVHRSDAVLANGERQEVVSIHLPPHHLLNIHKMVGHSTYVSLLTLPNPIGGELRGQHGAH